MKKSKKLLSALVATMAVGTACVFAANPFVDVPANSWAYQSVVSIANAGIIQGVDGTHFEGNRTITRYEAAEITAKAMANSHKANAQQRAVINKLAQEFANELNVLGVRVSELENKVGNVKLEGNARVRYIHIKGQVEKDASYDLKTVLKATAKVNDNVTAQYGVEYVQAFKSTDDASAAHAVTKVANLQAQVCQKVGLTLGRQDFTLGQGYLYDSTLDGVKLTYNRDNFVATVGYGKLKDGNTFALLNRKVSFQQVEGTVRNNTSIGVYHATILPNQNGIGHNTLGAYAKVKADKITVSGNYEQTKRDIKGDKATKVWLGKVQYGTADVLTPKSWDVWVEYINADNYALAPNSGLWRAAALTANVKSWGAGVDYVVAKNIKFQAMRSFASKKKSNNVGLEEETRAQVVFAF